MRASKIFCGALYSSTVICSLSGFAFSADLDVSGNLPAVSAVNGKVEFLGGGADADGIDSDGLFYGGAALSVPLGETFGFQADLTALNTFGDTAYGGAMHFFTRDPNAYLLGGVGGYVDTGSGHMVWGGGESELYLGNFTLRAIAGVSDTKVSGFGRDTDFLGIAEASFYATDNLRFSAEVSTVTRFESANIGVEWLMQDQLNMPVAFHATAALGEDGYVAAAAGLNFYFGGSESNKSLIRRHREDDPRIEAFPGSAVNFGGTKLMNGGPRCVPDADILEQYSYDTCIGDYVGNPD
ncbi:hypothetical protein [Aestuariivirga sp.]|uniref:hypothetical protein n=1 Tax=Aestuariivirga sp. TaxID=2650926 RepID=UPI0039E4C7C5